MLFPQVGEEDGFTVVEMCQPIRPAVIDIGVLFTRRRGEAVVFVAAYPQGSVVGDFTDGHPFVVGGGDDGARR